MAMALAAGCGNATAEDGTICGCAVTGIDETAADNDFQIDGTFDPDASVIMVLSGNGMMFAVTCSPSGGTTTDCDVSTADPPVPPGTYDLDFEVSCDDTRLQLNTDGLPATLTVR